MVSSHGMPEDCELVIHASTSDNFDTKKFQADYPELYSKYIKTVPKADSIRVTIREDKS